MNASGLWLAVLDRGPSLLANEWFWLAAIGAAVLLTVLFGCWLTLRYIPHSQVGVVEKLWSTRGSVPEGRLLALRGEAGYQARLLRGGVHFGYWRWQYCIHKTPLVTVPQGRLAYLYARDGQPLSPQQTLGRVVACCDFQDAAGFLAPDVNGEPRGQRGRQRAILREGVYAINPALFVVMSEDRVYSLRALEHRQERAAIAAWHEELTQIDGFRPVVIAAASGAPAAVTDNSSGDPQPQCDLLGIVTVHDGPSLPQGEIIAPAVGYDASQAHYHNNFQDPEAFLAAGGLRGRQYPTLTDGTYFINRWFATVERIPKTVVPIGYVGVVVSYYGREGSDVSGTAFRYGERVAAGQRGVWEAPLGPGKYAFNTYAGKIILVPTTNFVLHWITGKTETHRYDESLRSIDLVTRDAYEPSLPLSVVVHIDYQRAPSVIQRFGDVKKLITQTLDPMLSAYFRDIAHRKTMLELLHDRDVIQAEARAELQRKFRAFDIECVDVLIGKPDNGEATGKIENLLEQLRLRQLSVEQLETFERQRAAAEKLQTLHEAQALATRQTELTNARVQVQISESQGEADLARARRQAEQTVVMADAELNRSRRQAEQTVVLAEADRRQRELAGLGESSRIAEVGRAEASVLAQKVRSYGDSRLYALALVADRLAHSQQPLVPQRLFVAGGDSAGVQGAAGQGMFGLLVSLLVAERAGLTPTDGRELVGQAAEHQGNGEPEALADGSGDSALAGQMPVMQAAESGGEV